jgi:hypothetical protein
LGYIRPILTHCFITLPLQTRERQAAATASIVIEGAIMVKLSKADTLFKANNTAYQPTWLSPPVTHRAVLLVALLAPDYRGHRPLPS